MRRSTEADARGDDGGLTGRHGLGKVVGAGVTHPLGAEIVRAHPGQGEVNGAQAEALVPVLVNDVVVVGRVELHADISWVVVGVVQEGSASRRAKAWRTSGSKPSSRRLPSSVLRGAATLPRSAVTVPSPRTQTRNG